MYWRRSTWTKSPVRRVKRDAKVVLSCCLTGRVMYVYVCMYVCMYVGAYLCIVIENLAEIAISITDLLHPGDRWADRAGTHPHRAAFLPEGNSFSCVD